MILINMRDKKAVVEMSLSLVIYLIIGFVVLGLVIAYVVNMFDNAPEVPDMQKERLDAICGCSDNFCIDPQPGISIEKGSKEAVYFKVRGFDTPIECNAGKLEQEGNCGFSYVVKDSNEGIQEGISLAGAGFIAKDGKSDCQAYSLNVEGSVPNGEYYVRTYLYKGTDSEISRTIVVTVK